MYGEHAYLPTSTVLVCSSVRDIESEMLYVSTLKRVNQPDRLQDMQSIFTQINICRSTTHRVQRGALSFGFTSSDFDGCLCQLSGVIYNSLPEERGGLSERYFILMGYKNLVEWNCKGTTSLLQIFGLKIWLGLSVGAAKVGSSIHPLNFFTKDAIANQNHQYCNY